jgi:hypothetical protein
MRLQSTMLMWKIMVICLAAMLGGCGAAATPRSGDAPNTPLLLAQARWQTHRPVRYRLVVQENTADGSCRQSVEVQDEQVQAVLEDYCGRANQWTISRLFDWVAASARTSSACDPSSIACACLINEATSAVYDPQQGYPYSITYRRASAPNWSTLKLWFQLWGASALPGCARGAGTHSQMLTIRVISLTALP